MSRNKKTNTILIMMSALLGIVFYPSLLVSNAVNAQVYNESTKQQQYGEVIILPIEPEPKINWNSPTESMKELNAMIEEEKRANDESADISKSLDMVGLDRLVPWIGDYKPQ